MTVQRDGLNATDVLIDRIHKSKFYPQLHLLLVDGIAFGGLNIIDLPRLSRLLELPAVAVMRKAPDLPAMKMAIRQLPNAELRLHLLEQAGTIHHFNPFVFQVCGGSADIVAEALGRLTDRGHVPEALRLSHLIGAAIQKGESGHRA